MSFGKVSRGIGNTFKSFGSKFKKSQKKAGPAVINATKQLQGDRDSISYDKTDIKERLANPENARSVLDSSQNVNSSVPAELPPYDGIQAQPPAYSIAIKEDLQSEDSCEGDTDIDDDPPPPYEEIDEDNEYRASALSDQEGGASDGNGGQPYKSEKNGSLFKKAVYWGRRKIENSSLKIEISGIGKKIRKLEKEYSKLEVLKDKLKAALSQLQVSDSIKKHLETVHQRQKIINGQLDECRSEKKRLEYLLSEGHGSIEGMCVSEIRRVGYVPLNG